MALNNTQANAVNTLARYLNGPVATGRTVTAEQATEALKTLLDGANKQLHAGLLPEDAADLVAAIEQLREETDRYHLTDAAHAALAHSGGIE